MHETRIRIRWRDMDAYGHVNNGVYLTYLEECRDAWAQELFGSADGQLGLRAGARRHRLPATS